MATKTAPPGLKARGRRFWRTTTGEFEFSDAETALLEEACRCLDRLDSLDQAITTTGPMVTGSQGQPVVNPALTEARGQQVVLHRLLAALRLPDVEGDPVPSSRATAASNAAEARWKKGK